MILKWSFYFSLYIFFTFTFQIFCVDDIWKNTTKQWFKLQTHTCYMHIWKKEGKTKLLFDCWDSDCKAWMILFLCSISCCSFCFSWFVFSVIHWHIFVICNACVLLHISVIKKGGIFCLSKSYILKMLITYSRFVCCFFLFISSCFLSQFLL